MCHVVKVCERKQGEGKTADEEGLWNLNQKVYDIEQIVVIGVGVVQNDIEVFGDIEPVDNLRCLQEGLVRDLAIVDVPVDPLAPLYTHLDMLQARILQQLHPIFGYETRNGSGIEGKPDLLSVFRGKFIDPLGIRKKETVVLDIHHFKKRKHLFRGNELVDCFPDFPPSNDFPLFTVELFQRRIAAVGAVERTSPGNHDVVHLSLPVHVGPVEFLVQYGYALLVQDKMVLVIVFRKGQGAEILKQRTYIVFDNSTVLLEPEVMNGCVLFPTFHAVGQFHDGFLPFPPANDIHMLQAFLRRQGRVDTAPQNVGRGQGSLDRPCQVHGSSKMRGHETEADEFGLQVPDEVHNLRDLPLVLIHIFRKRAFGGVQGPQVGEEQDRAVVAMFLQIFRKVKNTEISQLGEERNQQDVHVHLPSGCFWAFRDSASL